jgi:hypothetical protein
MGYKTHFQSNNLDREVIRLGTIALKADVDVLDEILIKVSPPVLIKKDTLEFNASSFKTKKEANVEIY